jgi:hypothetical protein
MKYPFSTGIFSFFILNSLQCIEEINLAVDASTETMVIQGLIGDHLDSYQVEVKTAREFGLFPVEGASVLVVDDEGNEFQFQPSSSKSGLYEATLEAQVNRQYQLQVSIAGREYKSIPSQVLPSPVMRQVTHRLANQISIDVTGNQLSEKIVQAEVDVDFSGLASLPYLRWRMLGEYEFHEDIPIISQTCYIKETIDLNKLLIYSPRYLNQNTLVNQAIHYTKLDKRFTYLYCFHISQYTMNAAEYQYWDALRDLIENKGTLYDPPVGNIRGNIYSVSNPSESVVGYFSVAGIDTIRYFVNPLELIPDHPGLPCGQSNSRPKACDNCLSLQNSTIRKPSYWP